MLAGDLVTMLHVADRQAIGLWHRALAGQSPAAGPAPRGGSLPDAAAWIADLVRRHRSLSPDRLAVLAAVELTGQLGAEAGAHDVWGTVTAHLPGVALTVDGGDHATVGAGDEVGEAVSALANPSAATRHGWQPPVGAGTAIGPGQAGQPHNRTPTATGSFRHDDVSALPFLVLRTLGGFGFVEAVAASFSDEAMAVHLRAFAAALAYKTLSPVERGWRRAAADYHAAAAFVGSVGPVDETSLTVMAEQAAPAVASVTAAVLASAPAYLDQPDRTTLLSADVERVLAERRGVPLVADGPVERQLADLVGVAWAVFAETLWAEREAAHPLQTPERFGDMTGSVSIDDDDLVVRLPMGRRRSDLSDHGLMGDIGPIPWLNGRVIRIEGG